MKHYWATSLKRPLHLTFRNIWLMKNWPLLAMKQQQLCSIELKEATCQ